MKPFFNFLRVILTLLLGVCVLVPALLFIVIGGLMKLAWPYTVLARTRRSVFSSNPVLNPRNN